MMETDGHETAPEKVEDGPGGRLLGIDLGSKRIGLALSDPDGKIASPLQTLQASRSLKESARQALRHGAELEVSGFVVGLPLNMDGSEGPQAELARRFGAALREVADAPIYYWDERLTSHTAQEVMITADLTRKKRKALIDQIAAQMILQSFLDARGWRQACST